MVSDPESGEVRPLRAEDQAAREESLRRFAERAETPEGQKAFAEFFVSLVPGLGVRKNCEGGGEMSALFWRKCIGISV